MNRWFAEIAARPAVAKMMGEMDKVWQTDLVSIAAATDEIRDRLFGAWGVRARAGGLNLFDESREFPQRHRRSQIIILGSGRRPVGSRAEW